jgi:hypothetical protein
VQLWERLRKEEVGLENDSDFQKIALAMERISEQLGALESGGLARDEMMSLADETKNVASHLASLHKRLRGG